MVLHEEHHRHQSKCKSWSKKSKAKKILSVAQLEKRRIEEQHKSSDGDNTKVAASSSSSSNPSHSLVLPAAAPPQEILILRRQCHSPAESLNSFIWSSLPVRWGWVRYMCIVAAKKELRVLIHIKRIGGARRFIQTSESEKTVHLQAVEDFWPEALLQHRPHQDRSRLSRFCPISPCCKLKYEWKDRKYKQIQVLNINSMILKLVIVQSRELRRNNLQSRQRTHSTLSCQWRRQLMRQKQRKRIVKQWMMPIRAWSFKRLM